MTVSLGLTPNEMKARRRELHRVWCEENREYRSLYNKQWHEANKNSVKARTRIRQLKKYDLTPTAFDELLNKQKEVCASCGTEEWCLYGPEVDHCHDTNTVRGIVCGRCNKAAGAGKKDFERLKLVLKYLEKFYGN